MTPRVALYTCVTGGYDPIRAPERVASGVDYFCFTDAATAPAPWRLLPVSSTGLRARDQNRYIKMHPHRIEALSGYDLTVYVDGSIVIVGDLEDMLRKVEARDESVFLYEHPLRNCVYEEGLVCAFEGFDSITRINRQLARYRAEGFPEMHGLFEASVMVRRPVPEVSRFMERWWAEYRSGVKRDQLSLTYGAWKEGVRIGSLGRSDARFTHRIFRLEEHTSRRRRGLRRAGVAIVGFIFQLLRGRINKMLYRTFTYPALRATTETGASVTLPRSAATDSAPPGRGPR